MKDFNLILNKIKNKEPFALVRFGDGEFNVLNNIPCNRQGFSFKMNNGFFSESCNCMDEGFRSELQKVYKYKSKNFYIATNKKDAKISAMIFINANYINFLENFIPLFNNISTSIVCHSSGNIEKLPFKIKKNYEIQNNAWYYSFGLEDVILRDLKIDREIVLVAGGAYSCVLIKELWEKNKNNIYIDIGSTLDPFLFGKKTRKYHERLNNEKI